MVSYIIELSDNNYQEIISKNRFVLVDVLANAIVTRGHVVNGLATRCNVFCIRRKRVSRTSQPSLLQIWDVGLRNR